MRPPQAAGRRFALGLVLATYERPGYLGRCLASLRRSRLRDVIVAIVDDASADPDVRAQIEALELGDTPIVRLYKPEHHGFGVHDSLRRGWDALRDDYGCALLANVDADAIVIPSWLERLRALYGAQVAAASGPLIVTGFNALAHPVEASFADYRVKRSLGGLNLLFDAATYTEHVRACLDYDWDWRVVHAVRAAGGRLLCTRPSVVQHIGRWGHFSSPGRGYDVAPDFWLDAAWFDTVVTRLLSVQQRVSRRLEARKR